MRGSTSLGKSYLFCKIGSPAAAGHDLGRGNTVASTAATLVAATLAKI
jgi:hypothetical protein